MYLKYLIVQKLGIDKAVFYTLLSRGLQIFTAFFTVFFIAKYLSPEEQGYYYTFGSLVAIQVFFELGLTSIITQFVAYEAVHLEWKEDFTLLGDSTYKSRLSSLLHFCAKWYAILSILIIGALIIVGIVFFNNYNKDNSSITWKLPWILLVIGTAFNFLLAPITAFIEGLGKVKEVAQIRLIQQIIHPIIIWGGLAIGSKLFVSGADAILKCVVIVIVIFYSPFYKMLKSIWKVKGTNKICYKKEIFPLQWRIALSWISGYFIFQLFNPVLFATEGAKIAGQMGMTITALNALQALTQSWVNTKVPLFSNLIAQKKYSELDNIFNRTKQQMISIGSLGLVLFICIIYLIQHYSISPLGIDIGNRFLPIFPLILMTWSTFTMFPISCWSTYLRCHKREPLMWNSIIVAILCAMAIFIFGKAYGLYGICISFAILRLLSLTWIHIIYKKKKNEWHK
ncbi:lipopolysaccharide biosynthesis protein [Phocaeicola plebeius]|uniref:lipopolysaccharide biosynthesis protein n=1 Tax=Phocaeicola plebeius TaxID=310297 RepID=UPI003F96D6C1